MMLSDSQLKNSESHQVSSKESRSTPKVATTTVTLSDLRKQLGGLGNPSKMPGASWGISAEHCQTGSKLRKVKGSVCEKCYALKGRYTFKGVKAAHEKRFDAWAEENWVADMTRVIAAATKKVPYFRWFDSGDLQGVQMFVDIVNICRELKNVKFWMPTKERSIVEKGLSAVGWRSQGLPSNLVVRLSDPMIGAYKENNLGALVSGVAPRGAKSNWQKLVDDNTQALYHCPAPLQENNCGDCRACWDPTIKRINYLEH